MTLQQQDGDSHPIPYGEVWRHCFTSLVVHRKEVVKLFTSTYDNFIQTSGIRDGVSYWSKILSVFYDNLNTVDPNDPDVIIKIDISNSFNTTNRVLTLDVISGRASRDLNRGE